MIRRLYPEDVLDFARLRRQYLVDAPLAFASSPESDPATLDALHEILDNYPESVLFGAFDPGLVGAVAFYRDPQLKARHKGHIWGLYVSPSHRGRGLGSTLLEAAIAHARDLEIEWVHLSVTSASPQARRMYAPDSLPGARNPTLSGTPISRSTRPTWSSASGKPCPGVSPMSPVCSVTYRTGLDPDDR
jgi:ribosomal protein S18 acetylase RimI-like enzyme